MTYFEAVSIYQDLAVHIQYKDILRKTNEEVVVYEFVKKYGIEQIREAVKTLCKELDKERALYLDILDIAQKAKIIMERKKR